ncbi:MAG: transposase [Puniceicoccales bacterium]|nr:transposase [Puniceicoccales bacterium]
MDDGDTKAPQYTSPKCSRCGHVAEENRKSQAKFKCCNSCEVHADYHAAWHTVKACGAISASRLRGAEIYLVQ